MKRIYKRLLAFFMAALMTVTQIPMGQAYAFDNAGYTMSSEDEELSPQEDLTATATDADPQYPEEDAACETTETQTEESQEMAEAQTEEPQEEEIAGKALLSYIFVEKQYVTAPDVQNIMTVLGEEGTVVDTAELTYVNRDTGAEFTVAAESIYENKVLFVISHAEAEKAVYRLTNISYTSAGSRYVTEFSDAGLDVFYGVNRDVNINPDVVITEEELSEAAEELNIAAEEAQTEVPQEVEGSIVTVDESGNITSDNTIEEAIENAEEYRESEDGAVSGGGSDSIVSYSIQSYFGKPYSVIMKDNSEDDGIIIVLDPGHDNYHAGAQNGGYGEEDLVLKIALYCKAELEKYDGVMVYMTRSGDGSCPVGGSASVGSQCLYYRPEYAASVNADLLVSFHLNGSTNSSVSGGAVYYPNNNYRPDLAEEGKSVAEEIMKNLNALGISSGGGGARIWNSQNGSTYADGSLADYLAIIWKSKELGVPAVLIEHCYISSTSDLNNFLNTEEKLKNLGVADAKAIIDTYGLKEAAEYGYDGINYKAVFDFDYYLANNRDVAAAFGNDKAAILQHFVKSGMSEGRIGSPKFSVHAYRNRYPDLQEAFGDDLKAYYIHYLQYGRFEGRTATGSDTSSGSSSNSNSTTSNNTTSNNTSSNSTTSNNTTSNNTSSNNTTAKKYATTYNGKDYSAVYDYNYYVSGNGDVKAAFGNDDKAVLKHFVESGMSEGRQAKADFNVQGYKNRYADLRVAFGNDLKAYYLHYIDCGKKEGRDASATNTISGAVTKYNGVDYSSVYNYTYYISHNPDVKAAFGNDDLAVLMHFVYNGMSEGRTAKDDFNVQGYKNRYADLRKAFGNNLKSYYLHYIDCGKKEGRDASATSTLYGYETVYNGVNYAGVYDYNFYIANNPDVKAAFGNDDAATLKHFVISGMNEGRMAKADFNVTGYKNRHADLRKAFGNNLKSYYLHYIDCGKKEGRDASATSTVYGYETVYNGINYADVYDYNFYVAHNPDIKAAFGYDDAATLKHFVYSGMSEGRYAKESFNVNYYKNNYADLVNAFGNDLKSYYLHYIYSGKKENRIADKPLYTAIAGATLTNVNQLMAYYNANAAYPAFYANTDAPDLKTFCQMYIEEANAEGIRAEVAFAQAMKETNFLRYGGDVSISQYNFAGIGATGGGAAGASFTSVREGIRAQIQHLKAYASTAALKNACVDPRFNYVKRGSAAYVEWLGIQENPNGTGWATDKNYGYDIKSRMSRLLSY